MGGHTQVYSQKRRWSKLTHRWGSHRPRSWWQRSYFIWRHRHVLRSRHKIISWLWQLLSSKRRPRFLQNRLGQVAKQWVWTLRKMCRAFLQRPASKLSCSITLTQMPLGKEVKQWLLTHPQATGTEMEPSENGRSSKILSIRFGTSEILILDVSWTASLTAASSKAYVEKNNLPQENTACLNMLAVFSSHITKRTTPDCLQHHGRLSYSQHLHSGYRRRMRRTADYAWRNLIWTHPCETFINWRNFTPHLEFTRHPTEIIASKL